MTITIPTTLNAKLQGAVTRGIKSAEINSSGHLIFTLTDNSTADMGEVVGEQGEDGFSPVVTVTTITGGHRITITDAEGDHTFDVMDGTGGSGTGNFENLTNRPKYNGALMTGSTDIPTVPTKTSDLTNDSGFLTEHQSLSAYRTSADQDVIDSGKQATISDLATIRSGAALGATALQSVPNTYRTSAAQDIIDAEKQDAISDLATIRSGAAAGATALQSVPNTYRTSAAQDTIDAGKISEPAAEGTDGQVLATDGNGTRYWKTVSGGGGGTDDFEALSNRPKYSGSTMNRNTDIPEVKTSTWDAKQDAISDLATIRSGAAAGATALQSVPSTYRTAEAQDTIDSGKQDTISDLATIRSGAAAGATAVQPESGKGLFSGSYTDLTNKPSIPSEVTESTVTNWGFTKNAGTITGISMNGASKGTSGVVDLGTVITAHQDISGKANSADLAAVATSGSYTDLSNKPTIPTVPTALSSFTDDLGSSPTHTHSQYLTSHQDISGKENTSNKVTSLSSSSTDTQYPSAKCVYDIIGDVESALAALR